MQKSRMAVDLEQKACIIIIIMEQKRPLATVDIIIEMDNGIVLIKRKNPPFGWALPGGFIDYGESAEDAAVREAKEETNLTVSNLRQFHTYSDPKRDPRHHTISVAFIASARGVPKASDDAEDADVFEPKDLPDQIAFDHRQILKDFFRSKKYSRLQL